MQSSQIILSGIFLKYDSFYCEKIFQKPIKEKITKKVKINISVVQIAGITINVKNVWLNVTPKVFLACTFSSSIPVETIFAAYSEQIFTENNNPIIPEIYVPNKQAQAFTRFVKKEIFT